MRKILYLFLALALTLSSVGTAAVFAEEAETAPAAGAEAAEYLTALGVTGLENADLTAGIPRKEFAKIVSIIGGYAAESSATGLFLDVEPPAEDSAEEDYSAYINALAKAGIVSTGGWFEPDRNITAEEAATMLIRVLGYNFRAEEKGGYPSGYMYMADNLELFASAGDVPEGLTRGAALQLCVNALDTDMVRKVIYGGEPEYRVETGYTLAYEVFGIIHQRDVVDAVDLSALKGENPTSPYYMSVGGVQIYVNEFDTQDYLGYMTDVYYKYDANAVRNSLIWISKSGMNNETIIPIENIQSIGGGTVEYFDQNDKIRKANAGALLPVIYNSTATGTAFSMDMIKGKEGTVRLLDNDGDKTTDIVFVDAYTDFVVGAVDASGKKVYDAYNPKNTLSIDTTTNFPYTVVYDENGEETNLGGIASGSVLSVFDYQPDADQGYLKIYLSAKKINGILAVIKNHNDGTVHITVDDREYVLTDDCKNNCSDKLKAGNSIVLSLNKYGYVADMKSTSEMQFGFMIGAKQEGGLSKYLKLKIFTANDYDIEVYSADKVELDGVSYDSGKIDVINRLVASSHAIYPTGSAECTAQPIRYRLNSDGNVNCIDTIFTKDGKEATSADIDGNDALYKGIGSEYRYREGGYIFGGKFLATASTVFMGCPAPDASGEYADIDNYYMGTIRQFASGNRYTVTPYFTTDNAMAADYIIFDSSKAEAIAETVYISLVKEVVNFWENDEECALITVMGQSGESVIKCKNDFTFERGSSVSEAAKKELPATLTPYDLKPGDIIRYTTNMRGFVGAMTLHYRIDGDYSVVTPSVNTFDSSFALRSGYPLKKNSDGFSLLVTDDKGSLSSATDAMCDVVPNYMYAKYILIETDYKDGKLGITSGTYDDIMSYEDVKNDCTKIIMQTDIGTPRIVVIVK